MKTMRGWYCLLGMIAIFLSSLARADSSAGLRRDRLELSEVMTKARDAMGYNALQKAKNGFLMEGTANHNSVDGDYSLLFTPDGRYLQKFGGLFSETDGFDGKTGWTIDWSGMPQILDKEDLEPFKAVMAVQTGRWLAAAGPFTLSLSETETDDRQATLLVRLKKGVFQGRLHIDRTTWLPNSLDFRAAGIEQVWSFDGYRPENGVTFAHRVVNTTSGESDTYRIQSVTSVPTDAHNPFSPLLERPHDTVFNPDISPRVEVKREKTGHILVHPRINGQDVGWFILDSGAGAMAITPQAADAAHLSSVGKVSAVGVGGQVPTVFRGGDRFELGPMTVSHMSYVEIDLGFASAFFDVKVAGVCGYDMFSRAIVTLDTTHQAVELYDPDRYRLQGARWQELFLEGRNAGVRCRFEGDREAIFRLDTGANGAVDFHAPAVKQFKLLDSRKTTTAHNGGVGGFNEIRAGKLAWFELGGRRFENLTAGFALTSQGAMANEYMAGNVGLDLLAPFKIVFNYPHKQIAFVHQGATK